MTKELKKRALKRFLNCQGFYHFYLDRIEGTHAGDFVPHGYEGFHGKRSLVDRALGFLVDALDGTSPTTSSLDQAADFWRGRKFIDVESFSFEKCIIEMDVRQGTIENGVASNDW